MNRGGSVPYTISGDGVTVGSFEVNGGNPSIATISPISISSAKEGVFTVRGIGGGSTSFTFFWSFKNTSRSGSCSLSVTVTGEGPATEQPSQTTGDTSTPKGSEEPEQTTTPYKEKPSQPAGNAKSISRPKAVKPRANIFKDVIPQVPGYEQTQPYGQYEEEETKKPKPGPMIPEGLMNQIRSFPRRESLQVEKKPTVVILEEKDPCEKLAEAKKKAIQTKDNCEKLRRALKKAEKKLTGVKSLYKTYEEAYTSGAENITKEKLKNAKKKVEEAKKKVTELQQKLKECEEAQKKVEEDKKRFIDECEKNKKKKPSGTVTEKPENKPPVTITEKPKKKQDCNGKPDGSIFENYRYIECYKVLKVEVLEKMEYHRGTLDPDELDSLKTCLKAISTAAGLMDPSNVANLLMGKSTDAAIDSAFKGIAEIEEKMYDINIKNIRFDVKVYVSKRDCKCYYSNKCVNGEWIRYSSALKGEDCGKALRTWENFSVPDADGIDTDDIKYGGSVRKTLKSLYIIMMSMLQMKYPLGCSCEKAK